MRFRRFFATSVLAMGIGMSMGAVPASAAPSSDTFASAGAIDIAGTRGTTASDLDTGTRETGEPTVPGSSTAFTKWWRYIPASNGFVRFSTCSPTGMNPVPGMSLGLYTGTQVNLLTTVSQATNNCPAGYENAVLGPVAVTAGTYYYLQMGGASTIPVGEGDFNLTLDFNTAVPANDNWASATVISGGLPQNFSANNGLATVEVNEPRSDANNERQTLWYRWTATANGTISVNNCSSVPESNMDSRISVFTGSSPVVATDMSFVDDNDNGCTGAASNMSRVYVPVINGTSYWIKLSNNGSVNYGFPYSLQLKWVTTPENGLVPSMYPTRFKPGTTVNVDFDGAWGGFPTPTYARQWRLCDAAGASCANISGATGTSYTPVVGDIGKTLVLQVTATNSNGSTSASSAPSEVIDNTPANDLWANRVNLGTGSTISYSDDNNWATNSESGEPAIGIFAARNTVWYRWTPATSGDYVINNCLGGPPGLDFLDLMIGIRTGTTSLGTTTEVGSKDDGCGPSHPYRTSMLFSATAGTNYSIEVASKSAGMTGAYTLSIAPVGDPVVTVQPSVTGTAAPGGRLNLDVGDWISPSNIVPEIHWFACNASGLSCVDTGLSGSAFDVQGSHAGGTIKATVTLSNPYGTVTSSALSDVIAQDTDGDGILDGSDTCPSVAGTKPNGCLPSDIVGTAVPTISGNLVTGQTLTSSTGTWTVNNDPLGYTLAYQWQRCSDATPGSCSNIGGATSPTYVLVTGDLAKTIRVAVTATNADDTAQQYSLNSGFVTAPPAPPANTTPPAVSGNKVVGQTLSTTNGTWTPAGVSFTYEWLRCNDTTIGSCLAISSQTGNTYTLAASDLGRYIRSRVTGANVSGSLPIASAATAIVLGDADGDGVPDVNDDCPTEAGPRANGCLPSDIVGAGIPTIAGPPTVGQTLNSNEGSWTVLHDPLGYTASYQWQRCEDATPASCSNIAGAASNTYVLVGADFGKRVRVNVTATNADDTAMQSSAISNVISQIPGNTVLPVVSGTPRVTATLSTTQGTWVPLGVPLTNSWLRCNDSVSVVSCSLIPSQTGATYTLVPADNGKYIRSRVTGSNGAGTTEAESPPSAIVITDGDADGVPDGSDICPAQAGTKPNGCLPSDIVGTAAPTLSGTLTVGQTIASGPGSWNVLNDPLGYSLGYQWQRCDDATTASCSNISLATGGTYVLTAADYGKRVRVIVTASNADDMAVQSSAISNVVSQVPANIGAPTVTGSAIVGQVLTASQGTWTPGDAALTNAWLRCNDTTIGSCSVIAGQTGTTYTLVAADDGKYIRIRVTGTTSASSVDANSVSTAQVITVLDGDGDGNPDSTDVCPTEASARPNGCPLSDIVGNGIPTVSGTLKVSNTVSSTTGSWTVLYDPLGYTLTYQWQRCDTASTASCTNITGATASTRALVAADYGKRVRVNVTATNAHDTETQASAISSVISQVPTNSVLPLVTGTTRVGNALNGSTGTWTPADASFARQWLRCTTTSIGSCSPIGSATSASYTLVAADSANYIRLQVSGTAGTDTVAVTSAATAQVFTDSDNDGVVDASDACPAEAGTKPNGCLPSDIVGAGIPTISGVLATGQTISSTPGSWNVLNDQLGYTLSYQWQRCDDATTASCSNVSLATGGTYVLTAADYGKRVRLNVTASNADDTAIQSSAISGLVSQVPLNGALPTILGTARVGQTLTGVQGSWTPADATLANLWLRCTTTSVASCSPIAGQTGNTYTLVAADDGQYIRIRVTATTIAGSVLANSNQTSQIVTDNDNDGVVDGSDACLGETGTKPNGCLPSDIVGAGVPTISGDLVVGQTMSSTNGTWNVLYDQLSYTLTRQWQRCDDATAGSCSNIGGATAATYALTASDLGKRVRVVVTATNADDTASQSSTISSAVIAANSPPVNNVAPAISGTAEVGKSLTAEGTSDDWTPASATLAYAWLRCTDNASEASCSAIGSAATSTYALVAADSDNYIRVRVTATANALTTEIVSAASAKIATPTIVAPPPATPPPVGPNPATISGPTSLKSLKPSRTGVVTFSKVSVYCGSKSTGSCTGTAVLTGKIGGKAKTLGTLKLSNLKGGGRIIAMKLSRAAQKVLKKKPIKAQLAITYTAPGFTPLNYTGKVTLKKPKK
ncbi:MAG: thrombospondin type 3 repeat-containing protein [Solirubrobacterales bacterium]|nr:thrombospondin type 3 repeat-containing protein [Solirubrobacterales bacterium]